MKKQKTPKKLALAKETLRNLYDRELEKAAGGLTAAVICIHSQGQVTRCTICPGCTI
jgi:hypothetical protein